jgi:N-acetylmuramoyl-L-alanine amidase
VKSRLFKVLTLLSLSALLHATDGLKLRLESKSPLIVKTMDASDVLEPLSIEEPLLYLGGSLTWAPASKTAEVDLAGNSALLMLEDPLVIIGARRLILPSALHWKDGQLILSRAALELLFRSLAPSAPSFETASAEELAGIPSFAQTPASEPTVVPPLEPVIVKGAEPSVGASPAGRTVHCVVIDAGHGGHDPGAHGSAGVDEKDVCLDIALKIRRRIQQELPDVKVILTRDRDYFVTLRGRTEIANTANDGKAADLFISIHNNASPDTKSKGSQVFFYDSRSSDRAAEDLATRENEDANYLEFIMTDLAKSLVRDQSIMLAQSVQDQLAPLRKDLDIHRRLLSYAPFYVLARTKMPAILVEVAFITNPREERLLRDESFRAQVADGIVAGIGNYRKKLADQ